MFVLSDNHHKSQSVFPVTQQKGLEASPASSRSSSSSRESNYSKSSSPGGSDINLSKSSRARGKSTQARQLSHVHSVDSNDLPVFEDYLPEMDASDRDEQPSVGSAKTKYQSLHDTSGELKGDQPKAGSSSGVTPSSSVNSVLSKDALLLLIQQLTANAKPSPARKPMNKPAPQRKRPAPKPSNSRTGPTKKTPVSSKKESASTKALRAQRANSSSSSSSSSSEYTSDSTSDSSSASDQLSEATRDRKKKKSIRKLGKVESSGASDRINGHMASGKSKKTHKKKSSTGTGKQKKKLGKGKSSATKKANQRAKIKRLIAKAFASA